MKISQGASLWPRLAATGSFSDAGRRNRDSLQILSELLLRRKESPFRVSAFWADDTRTAVSMGCSVSIVSQASLFDVIGARARMRRFPLLGGPNRVLSDQSWISKLGRRGLA